MSGKDSAHQMPDGVDERETWLAPEDAELLGELRVGEEKDAALLDLDAMFSAVEQDLQREQGARAWLRSRSTRSRGVIVGLGVLLVVGALIALLGPRGDMGVYPAMQMALIVGLFVFALIVAVVGALWPLHRPPLPGGVVLGVSVIGGLGVPLFVALRPVVPTLYCGAHHGGAFWSQVATCFTSGVPVALPLLLLLWVFARGDEPISRRLLFTAAGAGLLSNLVLHLHCASGDVAHMLVGHVSLVGAFFLCAWGASTFGGRLRRSG